MNNNFVKTSDEKIANYLRKSGYQELPKEGNKWVFLNNGNLNFSDEDMNKINFSNILCV